MLATKKKEKAPLPEITKYNPMHTTVYNCGFRNNPNTLNRSSHMTMSKSLKPMESK